MELSLRRGVECLAVFPFTFVRRFSLLIAGQLLSIAFLNPIAACVELRLGHDATQASRDDTSRGAVVEKVLPHGEGEKAGLQEGDVLLHWSRGVSKGDIRSPFDLVELEIEKAPLGIVKLEGERRKQARVWTIGPADWGLTSRPVFANTSLALYQEGQELARMGQRGEITKAAGPWKELADRYDSSEGRLIAAWLFFHAAETWRDAKQWKEADDAYQSAIQQAVGSGPVVESQLLRSWANTYQQRSDWANAEKYFQQSIAKFERAEPGNLAIALDLTAIGTIWWNRGDPDKAEQYYGQSLKIREHLAPGSLGVAASFNGLGLTAQQRGEWVKAEEYHRQAFEICEKLSPDSVLVASSLSNLGNISLIRGDLSKSEQYFQRALTILKKVSPGSLQMAKTLTGLGSLEGTRGNVREAEDYYRQALAINQKLVPGSLDVASSLDGLGAVAQVRGDLTEAERYDEQALLIREKLAPGSTDTAATLNNLGVVTYLRGDLGKAEQYYLDSLAIREKLAPGSSIVVGSLVNLGIVAYERGDLIKAEDYYLRGLSIQEKLAPMTLEVAAIYGNLGDLAKRRGDLARADEYDRKGLNIQEKLAPESRDFAQSLYDLAQVAIERGDIRSAEQDQQRSISIYERLNPGSVETAWGYRSLGAIAVRRGDLAKAEEYYHRALDIEERFAPGSLDLSAMLEGMGDLALKSHDQAKAEEYYRHALAIREKLAPGSSLHAESLAAVASILRDQNQLDAAAQFFAQAVSALERQTARLGGSEEVRSGFRANHSDIYRDYVDLLLAQKQTQRAFEAVERSRARVLLEMLLASRVDVRKGADPALLEQERSLQESLAAKSARRLRLLGEENGQEQVAGLTHEVEVLERQYQDVEEQLRLKNPAYAALTQPQPMTIGEIRQLLGPDTLLLEYSLGEHHSNLFAVTSESLNVFELPGRVGLEDKARALYFLLTARNHRMKDEDARTWQARVTKADSESIKAASELSDVLLGRVAQQLGRKRLLIVAEGALLYVPFAALPEPRTSGSKTPEPLMIRHEILSIPSASILSVLRQQHLPRGQVDKEVVVFADPVFDAHDERVQRSKNGISNAVENPAGAHGLDIVAQSADTVTRSASDLELLGQGQLYLPRLGFSRREADLVLAAVGPQKGKKLLDFEASRKFAISGILSQYRIVHFATHALVDDEHPQLSGLVLSLVDQDGDAQDGFLGLEDIYNLDIPADLVVLSACDTALGERVEGEGMIGLTRGFMYAGASGVLGTLWEIDDFATAKLMNEFYKAIEQDHMQPADALRQAQKNLWRERHWSAPYYWSAFTLQGDWK